MKKLICAGFIVLFLLTSCSFGSKSSSAAVAALEATRVAQFAAATAKAAADSMAASAIPPTTAPTETVAAPPTETATPEPTATPTEIPVVKATTNSNANCRLGPDKVFALVELLNAGTSALVIGQYTGNGQWWKVRTDAGKECWVLGSNVSTTGDLSIVAMLESPPTPTAPPPPDWNGNWVLQNSTNVNNPGSNTEVINITMYQTGNSLRYDFKSASYNWSVFATVSADGMSATGTFTLNGMNFGNVRLYRNPSNLDQFLGEWWALGQMGLDGYHCGYRKGAGFPDPCRP